MEPLERRAREVELLRKRYGTVEHDQDYSWVLIRDIDVPDGWNRSKTDILALLGPNVLTPPDNVYVPSGLRLANGSTPSNYSEEHSYLGREWGQFSFHDSNKMWTPREAVEDGDNLVTFMLEVERLLEERR